MHYHTDHHSINARFVQLADELSAGCDQDFDAGLDELEREFAELRLQLSSHE